MKLFYLLTLIHFSHSQIDGNFWWLKDKEGKEAAASSTLTHPLTENISEFNQPDSAPAQLQKLQVVCCECVEFYSCVNGTINTDGAGVLNVRIGGGVTEAPTVNVDSCPGEYHVCCKVPDADPSCSVKQEIPTTEASVSYFTPHPESNCECISHDSCMDNLVVSDGQGLTSIELSNGRMVNHSKCLHALDVCCYVPDLLFGNETEIPTESEMCECVPSYLCTPDGFIRTDGAGVLDVRLGTSEPLKVCPYNPDLACCLPPKTEEEPSPSPSPPSECGQRNANGVGVRILGFKEGQTQFGEFPWVATLLRIENIMGIDKPLFLGGASLIHPRIIMTAAHKVKDVPWGRLVVRLGEWDTASEKESLPYQDVLVQEVIFHPKFTPGPLFHDIALLVLEEEAQHEFHISPICPAKSVDEVVEESCVINGWGVDEFQTGTYQRIMKSITLPLVRRNKCQNFLRKTRLSKHFRLHSSFICAGGEEGMDACSGDGGGPLACQRKDDPTKYLQVGITAWGIGCGMKDVPGVYVDVAEHYTWIMDNVHTLFPEPTAAAASAPAAPAPGETAASHLETEAPTPTFTQVNYYISRKQLRKERKEARRQIRQERRRNRIEARQQRREWRDENRQRW